MRTFISRGALASKEAIPVQSSPKVCMHVRGVARTDGRVMREATTLEKAGFAVSIVDIENDATRPVEEIISDIHLKHILRPDWLIPTHFKPLKLIKTVKKFICTTFCLMQASVDIYHAHDVNALLPCYVAAQLRHKLLIFDAHEMPLYELEGTRQRWIRAFKTRLFVKMLQRCAGVITVSPPIIEEMYNRFHISDVSLIRNIPLYIVVQKNDRLRQYLGLSSNVRIVLYPGNLQSDRSLDKLVHAAKFLERNIVIVLMGRNIGSTLVELETLATNEAVTDRLKIIPPVPSEELIDWTASADIGIIVSSPDYSLNVRMFLPNKLFEYIMAGLPVLSSPLTAITEVIKTYDVGRVLSSLEPKDIATEINAMLKDYAGLQRMRCSALVAAQNELCWGKESQQLLRLYQNIFQKHKENYREQSTLPDYTHSFEGE